MDFSSKYLRLLLVGLLFIWCFECAVVEAKQLVKCDSKSGLCNGNEIDSRIKQQRIMEGPLSVLLPFKHFWRRRATTPQEDPSDTDETSTYNPWYGNETTQENSTDIFGNTTDTSEWYNETSTYNPWYGNETTQENSTDIFWNTTDTSEWYNETSTYNPCYGNETTQENSTDIFWNTTDTSEWYNETSTYNPWYGNETTQENSTDVFWNTTDTSEWYNETSTYNPCYGNETTQENSTDIFGNTTDTSEWYNETSTYNPWYGNETTQENMTDIGKPMIHHHFWRRRRTIMKPRPISNISEGFNETSTYNPWYGNETTQENSTDIFWNITDTGEQENETTLYTHEPNITMAVLY